MIETLIAMVGDFIKAMPTPTLDADVLRFFSGNRGMRGLFLLLALSEVLGMDFLKMEDRRAESPDWAAVNRTESRTTTKARTDGPRFRQALINDKGWREIDHAAMLERAKVWITYHIVLGSKPGALLQALREHLNLPDLASGEPQYNRWSGYLAEFDKALASVAM